MFQALSNQLGTINGTPRFGVIFDLHPAQLQAYLDTVWETWRNLTSAPPNTVGAAVRGLPTVFSGSGARSTSLEVETETRLAQDLEQFPGGDRLPIFQAVNDILSAFQSRSQLQPFWHHLIYAYMIENTRIVEIAARLVKEAVHGERLALTNPASWRWIRNTEELFFKETSSYYIASVTSGLRPDFRAVRRNAYHRMFGMDLNHGTDDNQPYPYVKAETANLDFVRLWRDFLREVWRGFINRANSSGPKMTDDNAIEDLAQKLGQILQERRGTGRFYLSREEFVSVAALSWFHLTVSADSPIVVDLKASATTPEERTRRLGEVVRLPANARSRSFFQMAEPMSEILHALEQGNFAAAGDFYTDTGVHTASMRTLMSQWSIATGDDIKAIPTTGSAR
jgi:hypothetical protein